MKKILTHVLLCIVLVIVHINCLALATSAVNLTAENKVNLNFGDLTEEDLSMLRENADEYTL